ncbi:MAG TPA: hypothetical protein VN969_14685, partial [Streptosporangiaceae bacterium]|nr:hypothetical protein [Streptosporangiaceae bacterium]
MTAEPVTGHDDGEELPGSSPSAVPGTGASGNGHGRPARDAGAGAGTGRPAQDQGGYVESGTGWPEEAGSWTGTAGPHLPGP